MAGLNEVNLIGNLGKDPESINTQNGNLIVKFSIATSETWGKGDNRKEMTEWHNITVFGKLAEICEKYLHKGSKVYIKGRLKTDKWEKNGETKYSTGIIAKDMIMLDSKKNSDSYSAPMGNSQPANSPVDDDDEIPF